MESHVPEFQRPFYDEWHFSPVMTHAGAAFLSGVTGIRADGTFDDDPAAQFRTLFESLGRVLDHAGLEFGDIIEMTTYHTDMDELGVFRAVRDEFLTEPWPAWTAVGVTELASAEARAEVRLICRTPTGS